MSSRREKLLVELAQIVQRYGIDEVLALARIIRDPETASDLAGLLERISEAVRRDSQRTKKRPRKKIRSLGRADVRAALQERYTTLDSLNWILDRLKIPRDTVASAADAHEAILTRLSRSANTNDIEDDIVNLSTPPGGELRQLTDAIVTKPYR